jgi:DNA-binding NtrC family response regulator
VHGASSAALKALQAYDWPGNIRELRNVVERAVLLAQAQWLQPADFRALTVPCGAGNGFELPPEGLDLEQVERSFVVQALDRCGGNQTRAAVLLGMNRDQIRYRIEKFGLARPTQ